MTCDRCPLSLLCLGGQELFGVQVCVTCFKVMLHRGQQVFRCDRHGDVRALTPSRHMYILCAQCERNRRTRYNTPGTPVHANVWDYVFDLDKNDMVRVE